MRKASHHGKDVVNVEEIFPIGDTIEFGKTYLLPTSKVHPNKQQPRKTFPEKERNELAEQVKSMRDEGGGWGKTGLLQPISVRLMPGKEGRYEIIAGERRWQTFVDNNWKEIPATVYDINSKEALIASVVENEQRLDLKPSERGMAYLALINAGMTRREVAERVGKSLSTVSKLTKLIDAPEDIKKLVDKKHRFIADVALMKRIPVGERKKIIKLSDSGANYEDVVKAATKVVERNALMRQQKTEEREAVKKQEEYLPPSYDPMAAVRSIDRQLSIIKSELTQNNFNKGYWSSRLIPGLKQLGKRIDEISQLKPTD